MLVRPVSSSGGLHCVFLPGVLGPPFRGLQLHRPRRSQRTKELKKCSDVTAVAHLNTAIPPPSLLCCSPLATHNRHSPLAK
jgi:hypothetical protein